MDGTTQACLDVISWRLATPQEVSAYVQGMIDGVKGASTKKSPSVLAVRRSLSPVDVYCYLKARFGEPNGFQTFLRKKDDSDNWIHWDFNLKAGSADVCICGMSRETHLMVWAEMSDDNWRDLIAAIKSDFARIGPGKTRVLKSFEKWVVFPNKFVEIARVCSELHAAIKKNTGTLNKFKTPLPINEQQSGKDEMNAVLSRLEKTYRSSLELSLLTPILAEAFINMTILMLCKAEIRNNKRQFDDFMRSNIDVKLFDLAYKCQGFTSGIDQHSESFKKFKKIMDRRNHMIHGNCDPEAEQLETVYFEGTRPLFVEPGDHIRKFLEARERQYKPDDVIRDYEDTYTFLSEIPRCLDPSLVEPFNRIMETHYPGYDIGRKKLGVLFPDHVAMGMLQGTRYDDELM